MTQAMIEVMGVAAMGLAIGGCVLNNRRLRVCFVVWIISNVLGLVIHVDAGIWSLAARDVAFTVLAVDGWRRWGRRP